MLDNSADVEEREFGEAGITITGEQVLLTLPNRLVHMHSRTVIADDRLGHECCCLPVFCGDVMYRILQAHHPVGALD